MITARSKRRRGRTPFERFSTENDLGIFMHGLGRLSGAENLYRSRLETIQNLYGLDHPAVADHLPGKVLIDQGRFLDAEPWFIGLSISPEPTGPGSAYVG